MKNGSKCCKIMRLVAISFFDFKMDFKSGYFKNTLLNLNSDVKKTSYPKISCLKEISYPEVQSSKVQ